MEGLLIRQSEILEEVKRISINFKKDSSSRKTDEYIARRLQGLDQLWEEFQANDAQLQTLEDKELQYFEENIPEFVRKLYTNVRTLITTFRPAKVQFDTSAVETIQFDTPAVSAAEIPSKKRDIPAVKLEKLADLQAQQSSNFRALKRAVDNLNIDTLTEKWELEDEIKSLQSRWNCIDSVHLQVDSIMQGSDWLYEVQYSEHETLYKDAKKSMSKKLANAIQKQQSTPQMEIPTFSGNCTQWPTFMDLYTEAIHTNPAITKTQKMQHLKGKLRGEAEKLVQHLHISADNYDTCWEILTHRYDNKQLLFTNHMQQFLRQPNIQKQSAVEIKRLYDTTMEAIYAIHNLGVDTKTWDPMLVHILCEKLDTDTYADYMEARKDPRDLPSLDELMDFLDAKFTALEPISKRRLETPQQTPAKNLGSPKYQPRPYYSGEKPRNRAYYTGKPEHTCPFCNSQHALFQCERFLSMPADMQLKTITDFNICQNCLFVHHRGFCNSDKRCQKCNQAHNTKLHDTFNNLRQPKSKASSSATASQPRQYLHQQKRANYVASADDEIILPTARIRVKSADGSYVTLRALIDQGSQITIITEGAAQKLGLARQQYDARITGVGTLSNKCRGRVHLTCKSKHDEFQFTTDALIMSQVVGDLPNASFKKHDWHHITLADPEYNKSRPIDMLLDADIYAQIIMSGLLKGSGQQPIAQQTKLGWILSGNSGTVKTYNCNVVLNECTQFSKYWEIEEIANEANKLTLTTEEQYCEDFYNKTTRRRADGRYEVRYPMKPDFEQKLGESKPQAVAQFLQLERKLTRDDTLSENYKKFINEYLAMQHMKRCITPTPVGCYLPHHGVIKEDSVTTKLRVVFNASAKTSTSHSLNDLMECGPKLHKDLQGLLIQWRLHKYVFTADCEKMYRMIFVHKEDQKLQKIVWRNSPHEPLQEYDLCTLTYGTKAAPYLALRTLKQLAEDEATYQLGANALRNDIYVDDVLSGADTLEKAKQMQQELIEMLKKAGLNLRKWASNDIDLLQHLSPDQLNPTAMKFDDSETTKTLGLQWIPASDIFTFKTQLDTLTKAQCSKRTLLSDIAKIFDPLGWLSPLTIRAKLLFQETWTAGIEWDEKLPEKTQKQWDQIKHDIANIEQIQIPRWVGDTTKTFQLHGFCDSSERVYACAIYVTTTDSDNKFVSRLLVAKTKLAPLKKAVTLPRLELCGAVLLARLFEKVLTAFDSKKHDINIHAWTDSMIVLGWINGDIAKWKTFVANRVKQITDIVPASRWNHVKSEENAVDCATRGIPSVQLSKNELWWNGPKWLPTINYSVAQQKYDPIQLEVKTKKVCATTQPSATILDLLHAHSNMSHVARVVAWMLRFHRKSRKISTPDSPHLTSTELDQAYNVVIRDCQKYDFCDDIDRLQAKSALSSKSSILSLNPFLDENNILRVGGRLGNASLTENKKHPIILSNNNKMTELLIAQAHQRTLHGGPRLTLSHIRQKFWIIHGYRAVKKQLHRCVPCQRFSSQQQHQLMADLPTPRVTPSRPFTHSGVDFTGHVEIKANKGRGIRTLKGYVAVFVCLATKAIHLELVSDLSTTSFLAAFNRFCSRRGKPREMYSDNGTNFVGANRVLKQQYKEILRCINVNFLDKVADLGIRWHFNAPAWPSAGGLWEAAVKSMKHHLKRVIGDQKLTYEEFATLLCRIEACLNSRPLYQLTENTDDINCLTPGHFLVGDTLLSLPEPENAFYDMRTRWQMVQKMTRDFWKKWSSEYLQQLQARQKWRKTRRNLEINDIVCIREENLPPAKWALGRVIELHPGKDGHVRVVTLKTKNNVVKRPIIKLTPLLVDEKTEGQIPVNENAKQKRRRIPKPTWKTFLVNILLVFMMLVTPSQQQSTAIYNLTAFTPDQSLYFDKVTQLQQIRDEWKLIVYYNMTSYWQNTQELQNYVTHIGQMHHKNWLMQFDAMVNQLDHEMTELQHYNTLIKPKNTSKTASRSKRGLINGIGYIANELFGVLDERFAKKYETDITTIGQNENHLMQLLKNQTSVLEAEQNILQRNENIMNKQFTLINEHLQNITKNQEDTQNALYVMTNTIVANSILTQMRRIQESLIDMVTGLYQGQLDLHLIGPEQLQKQLDIITKYLSDDLTLPESDNLQEIYKLLRVQARVMTNYIIIEIKIPLLSDEQYELNKIVSLPQIKTHNSKGRTMTTIIPAVDFIAYNMKKDTLILLDSSHLQTCKSLNDNKILCSLNNAIYDIRLTKNICDLRLSTSNQHDTFCRSVTKVCTNKWIELHQRNTWMFACCEECFVRITCLADFTSKHLTGVGILTLGQGCVLKSDTITIHAHSNYTGSLSIQQNVNVPISPLNEMINTSTSHISFESESHGQEFDRMQHDIKYLTEQSQVEKLTIHDIHHYVGIYTVAAMFIILAASFTGYVVRARRGNSGRVIRVKVPKVISEIPMTSAGYKPGSINSDSVQNMNRCTSMMNVKFDTRVDD